MTRHKKKVIREMGEKAPKDLKKKYTVFNKTDGIPAAPDTFPTFAAASQFIEQLRNRFRIQGYYLTSDGRRISPDEVDLVIEQAP